MFVIVLLASGYLIKKRGLEFSSVMGLLLREVLKTLCGVNQWCYAVFWKIGLQNPKLLIWEECHYELASCSVPPYSGIENPELPFGEWEGCRDSDFQSSQFGIHAGDRVHMLINKMMMNNQVHVVGEGIAGRAAFTGNHEWILANNSVLDAHPLEVLNELHHQFSAGMQTVAVIPVCPHGVVQLGSSLTITENTRFVNSVKSLILQLGCVPSALMSDNHATKESTQRIGEIISAEIPVSMHVLGNYKLQNSSPLVAYNYNQQSSSSQSSGIVSQPSCTQSTQIYDHPESTSSAFHTSNLTKTLAKPSDSQCESKITPPMKPYNQLRGQQGNGVVGAEVTTSNPDAWMNQQAAFSNSRPGCRNQHVVGQSDADRGILTLLEQQILFNAGSRSHVDDNINALANVSTPYLKTNGGIVLNSQVGSLTPGRENGLSSHIRPNSYPPLHLQKLTDINHSSPHLAAIGLPNVDSSRAGDLPLASLVHQLGDSSMLAGVSDHRYYSMDVKNAKSESPLRKEKLDDDLLQALNIPSNEPDVNRSFGEHIPGPIHASLKHASGSQTTIPGNTKYEGSCAQLPSGDDLYDILGVAFKNKLLNGKWNNVVVDETNAKTQDMSKDNPTFMNVKEVSSDIYSGNEGISDSGIFSVMSTDNLLDAVVSRAHSAAKQSSNDNVSCRTTLTKISSSSVPGGSSTYGGANICDQVKRELFDLPKSLEIAGTLSSSSFRSSCSKDDVGSCSQTTSIYGSQLSSWVGHNVRRDNSASTAFSKKNDEVSKPNRKRLKPGENPRPRPKDRQMIQDRVKELREIVPNGAKCSIDALLERTIKHMLFLQSVTKHADKLKQTGESKIISKEGGLLLKDNFEGGATWAFEIGSQSMVCPILVEDLNPPRQLLVEMLCEERGLFLEIADLVRGLGLTILKGVMETKNDKIWARFAVEANRDVTRMEIFMSLVRLLEQTVKGGTSSANALQNNKMLHHGFTQATSIPATGMPRSLQ